MRQMRAQVSLMFDDPEVYNEFVIPYKNEKMLNGVIVRCLSAYYRSAEVRQIVDGVDEPDGDSGSSQKEILDSIRASLIMQDFLSEEFKNTVENGMEDVTDILDSVNRRAEERGYGKTNADGILQIEMKNVDSCDGSESTPQTSTDTNCPVIGDILVQALYMLARDSGNSKVTAFLAEAGVVSTEESVKTERQIPITEVLNDKSLVHTDEVNDVVEDTKKPIEIVHQEDDNDASDAMMDLFASLF